MIGGTIEGEATFVEALLALPRKCAHERMLAAKAARCSAWSDWKMLADVRADRCSTANCASSKIARALMLEPEFLLLDEPAAGLSSDEIERLGLLIRAISKRGAGVLLVEHHADLILRDLRSGHRAHLGRTLAAGTPEEIRVHKEVVSATSAPEPLPRSTGSKPATEKSACCTVIDLTVAPAKSWACWSQRRRQDHAASRAVGIAAGPLPGRCASTAAT